MSFCAVCWDWLVAAMRSIHASLVSSTVVWVDGPYLKISGPNRQGFNIYHIPDHAKYLGWRKAPEWKTRGNHTVGVLYFEGSSATHILEQIHQYGLHDKGAGINMDASANVIVVPVDAQVSGSLQGRIRQEYKKKSITDRQIRFTHRAIVVHGSTGSRWKRSKINAQVQLNLGYPPPVYGFHMMVLINVIVVWFLHYTIDQLLKVMSYFIYDA